MNFAVAHFGTGEITLESEKVLPAVEEMKHVGRQTDLFMMLFTAVERCAEIKNCFGMTCVDF